MFKSIPYLFLPFAFIVALAGCGQDTDPSTASQKSSPYIVAVNNPLYYFANRLIGDEVEVLLPVPSDIDPAQWRPEFGDLLQIQGAELVLLNGAGYSRWLDKISIDTSRLVVTSYAAKSQWIELEGQVTHSHGPQGDHAHTDYAFTTWMDMSLARVQAESVASAIVARWPNRADAISTRLQALLGDLESLDQGYKALASKLQGRQLIYSHPVYQYFERRYELPGQSLHWEPDTMPTVEQWQALEEIKKDGALFVWEANPDQEIVARMHRLDLEFIVIDPASNRTELNWLDVHRANTVRLR